MLQIIQTLNKILFLSILWILFSGYTETFFIACGIVSLLIVFYFISKMNLTHIANNEDCIFLKYKFYFFLPVLIKEVVKSTFAIIKLIWSKEINIDPAIGCINTDHKNKKSMIIHANAITLTPGTLSIMLEGDKILIHSLSKDEILLLEQEKYLENKVKNIFN